MPQGILSLLNARGVKRRKNEAPWVRGPLRIHRKLDTQGQQDFSCSRRNYTKLSKMSTRENFGTWVVEPIDWVSTKSKTFQTYILSLDLESLVIATQTPLLPQSLLFTFQTCEISGNVYSRWVGEEERRQSFQSFPLFSVPPHMWCAISFSTPSELRSHAVTTEFINLPHLVSGVLS